MYIFGYIYIRISYLYIIQIFNDVSLCNFTYAYLHISIYIYIDLFLTYSYILVCIYMYLSSIYIFLYAYIYEPYKIHPTLPQLEVALNMSIYIYVDLLLICIYAPY
jgi:hypothetical protein